MLLPLLWLSSLLLLLLLPLSLRQLLLRLLIFGRFLCTCALLHVVA